MSKLPNSFNNGHSRKAPKVTYLYSNTIMVTILG